MGYTNPDTRIVKVSAAEKRAVRRRRRRAEQRAVRGEHERKAVHATRRGWWYA